MDIEFTVFGLEFKATVEYWPLIPARTTGPVERCHEAEGGDCDITSLQVNGHNAMYLLSSDLEDQINEAALIAAVEEMNAQVESNKADYEADRYYWSNAA